MSGQVTLRDGTRVKLDVVTSTMHVLKYLHANCEFGALLALSEAAQKGDGHVQNSAARLCELKIAQEKSRAGVDKSIYSAVVDEDVLTVVRNALTVDPERPFVVKMEWPIAQPKRGRGVESSREPQGDGKWTGEDGPGGLKAPDPFPQVPPRA